MPHHYIDPTKEIFDLRIILGNCLLLKYVYTNILTATYTFVIAIIDRKTLYIKCYHESVQLFFWVGFNNIINKKIKIK